MKKTGVITTLSRKGTYLFIRPDGEDNDVFCHCSEIEDAIPTELIGALVEFIPREDDRGQVRSVRVIA